MRIKRYSMEAIDDLSGSVAQGSFLCGGTISVSAYKSTWGEWVKYKDVKDLILNHKLELERIKGLVK